MPFTLPSDDQPPIITKLSLVKLYSSARSDETNEDAALPDHQQAANYAEKVDDNFQSPDWRETLGQEEQDINSIILMGGAGSESSWEEVPPIINRQASSIGLHKEVEQMLQCSEASIKTLAWPDTSYVNIPAQLQEHCEAEEEEACVTPRGKEQRIPQEILICPPPPCKKRRTLSLPDYKSRKQLCYAMPPPPPPPASSASSLTSSGASTSTSQYLCVQRQYAACQIVVNPPNLHTLPACIRALFFHD